MNLRPTIPSFCALALILAGCMTPGTRVTDETPAVSARPAPATVPEATYVFGWGERPAAMARPRGGTSHGTPVRLAPARKLPLSEIASAKNAFARDRAAILALAGDFRTSFHFMETLALTDDAAPQRPYHSWATEHVRVIEDTGRFLSLQHTLVMFFQNGDGSASEPMLVKHWRQDWTYEPTELHTFRGVRTWERRRVSPEEAAGAWSQSVWQVDDSPRYAAVGRWTHNGNRSVWTGETSWRPLPRREFSVRQDYNVLEGVHEIGLTPTGWLHVQDNWKRVAGDLSAAANVAGLGLPAEALSDSRSAADGGAKAGEAGPGSTTTAKDLRDDSPSGPQYVGREYGLDRYERITAPSLVAADEYWTKTGAYWAAVRAVWREVYAQHDRFSLRAEVDGARLFEEHFAYAEKLAGGAPFDPADAERHARETIARFLIETSR